MTKSVTTMIAVLALAAGLSAQHGKTETPSLTGTWNMGLEGGHVIPVALVLKQDGATLTGTISMPTQRIGTTVDVALKGEIADAAFTLSGSVEGAKDPTTHRDQGQAQRRRDARGPGRDERRAGTARRHAVHGGAAEGAQVTPLSRRSVLRGIGATVALPFLDAMVPAHRASAAAAAAAPPGLRRDGARLRRQLGDRRQEEPVGAGGGRPRLRPLADQPSIARAVPRHPHHRQQHRRRPGESVHGEGDRRRSLPIELHVPHPGAPETDAGRRRPLRRSRSISCTRSASARRRRFRRCSCASRTSTPPAAAATATPASTPTRSAGRRPIGRCR